MARSTGIRSELRSDKIVEFIDAAYDFESDDQSWLERVMTSATATWTRGVAMHGGIYDARNIHDFRLLNAHVGGFSAEGAAAIMDGLKYVTPPLVARTFRTALVSMAHLNSPEMDPMNAALGKLGFEDTLYLNGSDPEGLGVMLGLWSQRRGAPPPSDMTVIGRMTHHLGAAYRCRRRLRAAQADRLSIDATEDAAAILDARKRVVHATGEARSKQAQEQLIDASRARDRARTTRDEVVEGLKSWRPLTATRWTLVDSFERGGARYIVARENPCAVSGLAQLSQRERQVVGYAAIGQSTKETAYALGISDATVRVLIARAAAKLSVKTRAELLNHPEVRPLRPYPA